MHTHLMKGGLVLSALLSVLITVGCSTPKKRVADNECGSNTDFSGRSLPFHTIPIDNGNDFNASREAFRTGTDAQSGYTVYATWDPCAIYLGMTGSAVGSGDRTDLSVPTCTVADLPKSPDRHLLFYLNTAPRGNRGTERAKSYGVQQCTLPFRADYLLAVRSDGRSTPQGDSVVYVGNWHLYQAGEEGWTPVENARVKIGDNSSSNFIEMRVPLAAIGSPNAVEMAGWVTDTRHGESFAYWPARNGSSADSPGSASSAYGDGSDNGDTNSTTQRSQPASRDSTRSAADSRRRGASASGDPASGDAPGGDGTRAADDSSSGRRQLG